jgi:GT2 family glycosyltransferase
MENITGSIVLYQNDTATVAKAVESFLKSPLAGKLFIIDNSPTDLARKYFNHPKISYLFSGSNLGYGKAHNIALRQCLENSRYHLVLNPDVYFDETVLEKLYRFMEENQQAGLVMPRVLYPDGTLQRICKLLPTPLNLATRRFIPFSEILFRKMNDRYEMNSTNYHRVMNVPFLSGCFMFLRTSALQQVGLFDERYFLYAEDTDLSRRIHSKFKTLFYPGAEIRHIHARGSYKDLRLTWHNLRSAILYFNKWGWFVDAERATINSAALNAFRSTPHFEHFSITGPSVAQRSMK